MKSLLDRATWPAAAAAAVMATMLLPVLQFLEANPYFKFRYGFDLRMLAILVVLFFAVPWVLAVWAGRSGRGTDAPRGRLVVLALAVALFASQLASTMLQQSPAWQRWTAVLVCAAAGIWMITRRPRELVWCAAVAAILVVPYGAFQIFRHWWWIPKPPQVPAYGASNEPPGEHDIFLLFIDGSTLTSDFLDADAYPDSALLPNLSRFMRQDAVWFPNAVSNGPETMVSLPVMFTGKLVMTRANNFLAKEPTIFSLLKPRYTVRAWLHTKSSFCAGSDFERCFPFLPPPVGEPLRVIAESWAWVSTFRMWPISYAIGKLDETHFDRAAEVGDFMAHVQQNSESPCFYTIQLFDRLEKGIRDFDALLGELTALLEMQGRYDDAIVMLVSDHGLNRDEGHGVTYGRSAPQTRRLYRVPFAIKLPGRGQGRLDPYPAQGVDLVPTLLGQVAPGKLEGLVLDGVDVLSHQPERVQWINFRERGLLRRWEDPGSPASRLVTVPVADTGLPSARP